MMNKTDLSTSKYLISGGHILVRWKPALPSLLFCIVLVAIGTSQSPVFLSTFNLGNISLQIIPLILVAIGQTYAVGSGGLDLSVGSTVSLVAVVTAVCFVPLGIPGAIAVGAFAALAVGLVNGLFVARGIEAFLVTLGTLSLVQGAALFVSPVPGGMVPKAFQKIAGFWGQMPIIIPFVLGIALIAVWSVRRTRTGTDIVAVGGSRNVAHLAGLPISLTLVKAHVICAAFAALAGFFLVARMSTGDPTIGARFTLDSLAAVVLGGTLLGGGRVVMVGTIFGAIALGLLSNVLNLLQVPSFYQTPIKGFLVISAVLLPVTFGRLVVRRHAAAANRFVNQEATS